MAVQAEQRVCVDAHQGVMWRAFHPVTDNQVTVAAQDGLNAVQPSAVDVIIAANVSWGGVGGDSGAALIPELQIYSVFPRTCGSNVWFAIRLDDLLTK